MPKKDTPPLTFGYLVKNPKGDTQYQYILLDRVIEVFRPNKRELEKLLSLNEENENPTGQ